MTGMTGAPDQFEDATGRKATLFVNDDVRSCFVMVGFMQYGGEYIKRMSLLFIFKVVNLFRETFLQLD